MDIIKQEQINKDFSITLQYYCREVGYEIVIGARNQPNDWHETNGMYSTKKEALKVYNTIKKEYKNKKLYGERFKKKLTLEEANRLLDDLQCLVINMKKDDNKYYFDLLVGNIKDLGGTKE